MPRRPCATTASLWRSRQGPAGGAAKARSLEALSNIRFGLCKTSGDAVVGRRSIPPENKEPCEIPEQ